MFIILESVVECTAVFVMHFLAVEVCFGSVHFVKKGSSAAIGPQQEKKDKKEKKAGSCWQVSLVQKPHLTAGQERKGGGAH